MVYEHCDCVGRHVRHSRHDQEQGTDEGKDWGGDNYIFDALHFRFAHRSSIKKDG